VRRWTIVLMARTRSSGDGRAGRVSGPADDMTLSAEQHAKLVDTAA